MGFSLGSIVNTVANVSSKKPTVKQPVTNISSRKTDKGKSSESSLYEFMNTMSNVGIQIKSNFEVIFSQIGGFQFYCQNVNIPGLKSNVAEINYKGRSIQIPINSEQEHDFQFTVINDASGIIYTTLREIMLIDYKNRLLSNGFNIIVKSRGDQLNNAGINIIMDGVRFNSISSLDYSQSDSSIQTFTIDGYVNSVNFEIGTITQRGEEIGKFQTIKTVKTDGLLGKVNSVSTKISNVLGK